ncbi:sodium channel and clathrin linker 1-like [Pollicipes pollicipes]|uniref:sodium channel and clathrin linker 1-like n=1 Tax=Pollicipes pollicipes TaxID=41117 RepID=UPI00188555B1|nr:sodium channel and clathrin linker 1-like [Pollicipes pollicipes]
MAERLQARDSEEVELQQQLERLMREKKNVEREYDRVKAEHAKCGAGGLESGALEELTARLARLEEARDLAERAAADLTRKLKSSEARHEIELERLAEDAAEQRRRLLELNGTCDALLDQKSALTEQLAAARAEHEVELAAATERRRVLERAVSSLEQQLRQKERLLNSEIQSYETDQEHTKVELRELLAAQQQMTAKWRRELLSASEQHEQKLARMRSVERDLARKITELEDDLRDTRTRELESEEEVKRYKFRVRELELRVQAAEKRFLTVHAGSSRQPSRRAGAPHDPRRHLED